MSLEALLQGGAGVSSAVQAVVDWYGPTDFADGLAAPGARLWPGLGAARPTGLAGEPSRGLHGGGRQLPGEARGRALHAAGGLFEFPGRRQLQFDTAGALLDAAYLYERSGGRLPLRTWRLLRSVIQTTARRWREQLGNFPQAFSHLGLISAAARIDRVLRLRDEGQSEPPHLLEPEPPPIE
ncbi:hypothetical protein [Corallococcus llansteffanensis]|uniref:hypothetical protein n=1 Tax=Corallococcus llansteffanensis TaxID=2316731 RepID=UPI001ABFE21D|nr:hypothetical protein [Corallococcus llansteffanensis]